MAKDVLSDKASLPVLVLLEGDLGVGKTTFVKELLASYGVDPEEVQSPTFLKLIEHEVDGLGLCLHVDAYRMEDSQECAALSLESYDAMVCCIVEWPKVLEDYFSKHPDLFKVLSFAKIIRLRFEMNSKGERKVTFCQEGD